MTRSIAFLAIAVLLTLAVSIVDILNSDPLIRGPLTAVILAFLVPGILLLAVDVSRKIDALPSKSPQLDRIGFVLGLPRVLFGTFAVIIAVLAPFPALGEFSVGVVRGNADLLPLGSLLVAPMFIYAGNVWIMHGLRISVTSVRRVRVGLWEIDTPPFYVKVLLVSCGLALAASLFAFLIAVIVSDLSTADLAWRPISSIAFFLISVPVAVILLRKHSVRREREH